MKSVINLQIFIFFWFQRKTHPKNEQEVKDTLMMLESVWISLMEFYILHSMNVLLLIRFFFFFGFLTNSQYLLGFEMLKALEVFYSILNRVDENLVTQFVLDTAKSIILFNFHQGRATPGHVISNSLQALLLVKTNFFLPFFLLD